MIRVLIMSTASPPSAGPLGSPGYRLWTAAARWKSEVRDALVPHSLTPTQFFVLGAAGWLSRTEVPNQRQLAEFAGLDLMTTSQVVRTLEKAKLLTRHEDPHDSRSWRLSPTAQGRSVLKAAALAVRAADERFFGAHSAAVAKALAPLERK